MPYIIKTNDLTKTIGGKTLISNVNMHVKKGEIYGFLGPNGAGKTTVMKLLTNLWKPTAGNVELFGESLCENSYRLLGRMGSMIEFPVFYEHMTGAENLKLHCEYLGYYKPGCIGDALSMLDLKAAADKPVKSYSLGMKQRLGLARAVLTRPELLILDEPTSGLDPLMQEAFFKLVLDYNSQGTTCFLSSHVLSEVKRYCKHAAIIREGEIIRTDTVENLSKSNLRRVRVWEKGEERSFSYTGDMKELIRELNETSLSDVLIEEPGLDELFMHYYLPKDDIVS